MQNSIRVAQWMLKVPGATSYFGSVGDDEYSQQMRTKAGQDGVNVQYQVVSTHPTGTCAVLVTPEGERSLIANLAAANEFKASHLAEPVRAFWQLVPPLRARTPARARRKASLSFPILHAALAPAKHRPR